MSSVRIAELQRRRNTGSRGQASGARRHDNAGTAAAMRRQQGGQRIDDLLRCARPAGRSGSARRRDNTTGSSCSPIERRSSTFSTSTKVVLDDTAMRRRVRVALADPVEIVLEACRGRAGGASAKAIAKLPDLR